MLVSQILKSKASDAVHTVTPGTSVGTIAEELSRRRIGAVIVSADGAVPVGIISERDIVRAIGERGASCLSDPVEALMTRKLVSCSRGDHSDRVLEQMTEGRFRHMPVLEEGALVGLVSIGDVVKARLAELAMERDALQGMVMGH